MKFDIILIFCPISFMARRDYQLNTPKQLGFFTTSEAFENGISQPTLSRMTHNGEIERIARGLYKHPNAHIDPEDVDLAVACVRCGPDSAIGAMTAAFKLHFTLNKCKSRS